MDAETIGRVNALTQEQRDAAYDVARKRIAGNQPTLEQYERSTSTHYPPGLVQGMRRIAYLFLFAAFVPSALRIFIAAFEMSAQSVTAYDASVVVAFMSILLAESGQIAFTLWASVTVGNGLKLALWVGALGSTAFALTANLHVVKPWTHNFLLAWIEALLPPVLVLIASHVLKAQTLHAIEMRYAAQQKYNDALKSWQLAYDSAELSNAWDATLANSMRDALRSANKQSKAVLRSLSVEDWRALVMRERKAEEWWTQSEQAELNALAERDAEIDTLRLQVERLERSGGGRSGRVSTNATGEVVTAQTLRNGDAFVKVCPECGERFEGDTKRSATNRLVAHMKKHRNAERKSGVALTVENVEQYAMGAAFENAGAVAAYTNGSGE